MDTIKKIGYKTAQAIINCQDFKAGDFVHVKYYFTDEKNIDWYLAGSNAANLFSAYPAHHLTRFTF